MPVRVSEHETATKWTIAVKNDLWLSARPGFRLRIIAPRSGNSAAKRNGGFRAPFRSAPHAVAGLGPFRLMRAASWFSDGMRAPGAGRSGLGTSIWASLVADMVVLVVVRDELTARAVAAATTVYSADRSLPSPHEN